MSINGAYRNRSNKFCVVGDIISGRFRRGSQKVDLV
jgi:hypothetical protein